GVTGYVAATGKSYVCADATSDPHYIEGAYGARSSLTVALVWGDKVIGTFNVESPQLNAFGPQDLQFAEIFCRELASALHTRVLVVDNDERVRRSAHSILGRLGCIVETARDGREALTMAKLSTYDVMLADIRLPDQGGYEVYRALRQAQPAATVILMTGYGYD